MPLYDQLMSLAPSIGGLAGGAMSSVFGPASTAVGVGLGAALSGLTGFPGQPQLNLPAKPQPLREIPKRPVYNNPATSTMNAASNSRAYPKQKPAYPKQKNVMNPLDSIQNMMLQQQQDRIREQNVNQQAAQQQNVQAAQMNQQMGSSLDRAFGEMQANFQQGAAVMQQYANDPMMRQLMEISMQRAQGNAIDQRTTDQMKGAASARNAAEASAAGRQARMSMAGTGVRGAARETLLAALRNDAAARNERQLAGIESDVAQYNAGQRGQALGQALGVAGARAGMAQDYARFMRGYDPLSMIGQMAGLQAPMQQIGYNVGRLS